MKLIHYRPTQQPAWSSFDRLHSLRDLFDSAFSLAAQSPATPAGPWAPAMDIYESENSLFVELELAGIKKENFDIALENDTLTISGHRDQERQNKEGGLFRRERLVGEFRRSLNLPYAVQADNIKAIYQDGILRIELPKAEEAKPKKIEVSTL